MTYHSVTVYILGIGYRVYCFDKELTREEIATFLDNRSELEEESYKVVSMDL